MAEFDAQFKEIEALVNANSDAIRLGTSSGTTATVNINARVRKICDCPRSEVPKQFFDFVSKFIKAYMMEHFGEPLLKAKDNSRELFARAAEFNRAIKSISNAIRFSFLALDTCAKKFSVVLIHETTYASLMDVFTTIKPFLFEALVTAMNNMRDGDALSRDAIRTVVEMIRSINAQTGKTSNNEEENYFVEFYCDSVFAYYDAKGNEMLTKAENIVAYANWAGSRINDERKLLTDLGMSQQWDSLKKALTNALARKHFVSVVHEENGGLAKELDEGRDVSDLFALLELVQSEKDPHEGVREVSEAYRSFAFRRAQAIFDEKEPPQAPAPAPAAASEPGRPPQRPPPPPAPAASWDTQVYEKMMKFWEHHLLTVWPNQFKRNTAVLQAFEAGIAKAYSGREKVAKLHSDFCHDYFSRRVTTDELTEEVQNNIYVLRKAFEAISAKDVFRENYKTRLARRLLRPNFRRAAEMAFLGEFKALQGNAEVFHLTAMVADLDNSLTITKTFLETNGASLPGKVKPSFITCSRQYWPSFDIVPMTYIADVQAVLSLFERYYSNRFSTRRIDWFPAESAGTVAAAFPGGPKELSGALIQIQILMLCDGTRGMDPTDLAQALGTDVTKVCDAIASMSMSKVNVLKGVDKLKNFAELPPTAKPIPRPGGPLAFAMNEGFRSPNRKQPLIPIQAPKKNATAAAAADAAMTDSVLELRKIKTRIAIIRHMKSRGTANFIDMREAVIKDLKRVWDAQPAEVKTQLDNLIDTEFIKRNEKDRNLLEYIA